MTRPGNEHRCLGPLVNTLPTRPMSETKAPPRYQVGESFEIKDSSLHLVNGLVNKRTEL